jgi:hypothetical protein
MWTSSEQQRHAAIKAQHEPDPDYSDKIKQGLVAKLCGHREKAIDNFSAAMPQP